MNEADTNGHTGAPIEALAQHRRSSCESVLVEVLTASEHDWSSDLPPLEDDASSHLDRGTAFYWRLAALSLEDRAIALAETWLDDPHLAPERRERLMGLLSAIPGYWMLKGLDDQEAENLVGQAATRRPLPLPTVLGFVLEILTLAERVSDRDRLLHG